MPRTAPETSGGMAYQVPNRSARRAYSFRKTPFEAFRRVMIETPRRHPICIPSKCVTPNHRHLAVQPAKDLVKSTSDFPAMPHLAFPILSSV
jgi:REP element-mobilizing transposase RayT